MMNDRRTFLKILSAAIGAAEAAPAIARQLQPAAPPATAGGIRKSVLISMLPKGRTYAERFAIGRAAGFEAIEMRTMPREEEAAEIREASRKTGLSIHSVMNEDHWRLPLSSSDPDVVTRSVRGMERRISGISRSASIDFSRERSRSSGCRAGL
jgi:hexulose-6-phosphate isomerase